MVKKVLKSNRIAYSLEHDVQDGQISKALSKFL